MKSFITALLYRRLTMWTKFALVVDWKWKMANADVFPLPGPSTRKQVKPVNSKQQNIILNVVNYFVKEKENGGKPLYRSHAIVSKTAAATGLSSTYIRKLAKEGKAERPPGKNRHQKKRKFGKLDDFDLSVIRRIIRCFICEMSHQQLLKFWQSLKEKWIFHIKNLICTASWWNWASNWRDGGWRESFMKEMI